MQRINSLILKEATIRNMSLRKENLLKIIISFKKISLVLAAPLKGIKIVTAQFLMKLRISTNSYRL